MKLQKILQKKPLSERERAVLSILEAEYQEHQEETYRKMGKYALNQAMIAERWADKRNQASPIVDLAAAGYSGRSLKSSVSRAIVDLLERKSIIKVDKGYLIKNIDTLCYKYRDDLLRDVCFWDEDLYQMYDGVYAVKIDEAHTEIAKKIFYDLLGDTYCFSINKWDNLLIIMLRELDEETAYIVETLAEMIQDIYQEQQLQQEKKSLKKEKKEAKEKKGK